MWVGEPIDMDLKGMGNIIGDKGGGLTSCEEGLGEVGGVGEEIIRVAANCPPIQSVSWHKHLLKSTPPSSSSTPTSPLHTTPSNGTCQRKFSSRADESYCAV